ncbi:enoyl-CoA hydratase-related protein [Nitratireductor sp. ZSWI3]|uniref:enoyl-CoA hydratase-related protein n=1 Tax=Nitratireductor sp. ZSWI3 TaxID=2966359 RepID=UPI00215010A0|nr:enoyl-CoA hydratase-related protein [Nitratireductor sp. ZSWI3]MCR4265164.1 enoyl-CoA hydratase-related protein [Nitratireductor sp. ZSWI3]
MTAIGLETRGKLARVAIDNPPVNALARAVRAALLDATRAVERDPKVQAVILCCAGRSFVAGADIHELGQTPVEPHLPDVLAAIEGSARALGGGDPWHGARRWT